MGTVKPGVYAHGKVVDYGGAYIYIPNNLSSISTATIINPGSQSFATMCGNLYSPVIEQGTDHIVVIAKYDSYMFSDEHIQNAYNRCKSYLEQVAKDENTKITTLNTLGSSAGDRYSLKEFANACKEGVDNGYCVITGASTLDNISNANRYYQPYSKGPNWAFLSDEEYGYMKGKTVYVFEGKKAEKYSYVKALVDHDVNVVLVECKRDGHDDLTLRPLNTNVFDLLDGNPENFLKDDNYSFWKCVDSSSDNMVWVNMSDDEVREATSANYMEILLEKCKTLEEFSDRYKSANNTTLASNLAFVSNSMQDLKGMLQSHDAIEYKQSSENEAGVVESIYTAANYYGNVTNVLYGNLSSEADAVYAIANAIYQMDGCAAEIAGDTLTDGMKSLYDPSNPAMAAKLDELSKTTADLVDTAKNAVAANSLYDNLTNLLTKSESEDHVGKISINSLENAINSIVPSLNDEVNRAQSLKAGVDDFMSGIGASNILQGGVWEDVKTNMETYQNLLDCNMKAAEFISDTIKTAMGVIVDYIEGSSDLISAVAKTDYGSFVSAGEMDDSRLGEIDNTLKTIAIQIEGIKRTIAEMKKAQECVEQSTIDSEGNVFSNQVCTPKYTDADIKPFEEELEKYKEAQTALTAYADRLRGFATVVQKAQQMINDAIEQVKNAYENPTLDANGNPTFAADFKLDMSAYGFEKDGDYYKNLIDDYYDKLNPKEPEKSTEGPTHPGDYFGGYGNPSGGTSGGSSNDTTEPETEVVTEVVSEANTEIVIERTTEMITEVPTIGPTEPKPKQGEGGSRKPQGPRNPYVEPTEDEPTIQNLPYEEIIDPNSEFYETEIKQPEIVNLDAIVEPTPAPQPDKSLRTMGVATGVGVALGAAALGAHTIIQQKEDEEDEDKDYGFEK